MPVRREAQFMVVTSASGQDVTMASLGISRQRRVWTKRAEEWDHGSVPGLDRVIEQVLGLAKPEGVALAVDLGCGTGALTLPLARMAKQVVAVDVSQAMIDLLRRHAQESGLTNIDARTGAIEELDLAPGSVDVVVTNYARHHLRDRDKQVVVERAARWLRPGGRLVIGDMMFGRGGDARDWAIAAGKVKALVRKGPGGVWRVVKNLWRYTWRVQERPVSMSAWQSMLRKAGFEAVEAVGVLAEAGVVGGRLPATGAAPAAGPAGSATDR